MTKPGKGTIDEHPDRGRIEFDLCRGVPIRALMKKYNVGKNALYNYKAKLPPQLRAAHIGEVLKRGADLDQLRVDMGEGVLQNLATQMARLLLVQDQALEAGDTHGVVYSARTIARVQELVAKLLGELQQHHVHTTISVLIQPEYLQMRSDLLRALAPYADARRAVASVLYNIENKAARLPSPDPARGMHDAA